jgi:25S rRNA (adenine2142-N1)-methyltransferase
MMKSRKKARQVTTLFHKYTRELDAARKMGDADAVQRYEQLLKDMGGRSEYQRASQLSTSFHSTSKWVLKELAKRGWLHGIALPMEKQIIVSDDKDDDSPENGVTETKTKRNTRLLEVGAINRELLDAAASSSSKQQHQQQPVTEKQQYGLQVKAIDLNSMHDGIEQADFLTLPILHRNLDFRYDVVVCSMVVNCVPTPQERGTMLCRMYHQLRPGGLAFLTLPKLCLQQSPYLTPDLFQSLLVNGIGFELVETKESPKVAFFILARPTDMSDDGKEVDSQWTQLKVVNRGKKFRNTFAVSLQREDVLGTNLSFDEE